MVKSNDISGVQLLEIIFSEMKTETAGDVITHVFKAIVPALIKRYIPNEHFKTFHQRNFDLIFEILAAGTLQDLSTKHLLVEVMFSSAKSQDDHEVLKSLFNGADIRRGNMKLSADYLKISAKHKHDIVKSLWSATYPEQTLD
jgi:hypothetical protein